DPNQTYRAPRNEAEQALAAIWQELLGVEQVGIDDNFFELGGDSIITIQVVSRARKQGYILQVSDLFSSQTIAQLAALITSQQTNDNKTQTEQGLLSGPVRLLPIQQWFLGQDQGGINHYNQDVLLQIDKSITGEELNTVLRFLVAHHDGLRMRYQQSENQWLQEYGSCQPSIQLYEIEAADEQSAAAAINNIGTSVQQSLDITS
ncbi:MULTISPECIES: phosphopantetheine-binding protein, partial [Niastella]